MTEKTDEWKSINLKPEPYALLDLKLKDRRNAIKGWWTGNDWFGRELQKGDVVAVWRHSRKYQH